MNKVFNFFDNTFVINRQSDEERMKATHDILYRNAIPYKRFNAITPEKSRFNHTTKEIEGCGLSHRELWKHIVQNKIKHAIILEDDISFTNNWTDDLNSSLKNLPKNWDILTLGNFGIKSVNDKYNSPFNFILYSIVSLLHIENRNARKISNFLEIPYFFTGAYAYAISYKGAKKLLRYIKNINFHIDVLIAYHSNNLNIYSITNDICYQRTEKSTINSIVTTSNIKLHFELFKNLKDDKNINYDYYMNVPVYKIQILNNHVIINGWMILLIGLCLSNRYTRSHFLRLLIISLIYKQTISNNYKTE